MEAVARQDTTEIRTNRQRESSAVLRGGGGSVRTHWDEGARRTRLGGVAYFAAFDAIALSQLYGDRGDCENIFDELKNQWGWGGFVTHDLARTCLVARALDSIHNYLRALRATAEQLGPGGMWEAILRRAAFRHFLGGKPARPPPLVGNQ